MKNSENDWVSVKNTDFQWICSQKYYFSVKMQWKWLNFSENSVKNTDFQWKHLVHTEHVFEYIPQNSPYVCRRQDGLDGTRSGQNLKVAGSNLVHSAFWGQLLGIACAAPSMIISLSFQWKILKFTKTAVLMIISLSLQCKILKFTETAVLKSSGEKNPS